MFSPFGINYFQLRSFSFQELNLPVESEKRKYTVDLVEAYFHILQIPVFSLGKKLKLGWYGDYSDIPANLESQVDEEKVKARGKWYSFSGLYILILIGAFFLLDKELKHQEEVRLNKLYQKGQTLLLKNPQIGDCYYFSSSNLELQAEIHAISQDSLLFTLRFPVDINKRIDKGLSAQQKMDQLIQLNERRNFLNDSLRDLYPREPILADVLALRTMDSTYDLEQLWVSRKMVGFAFCRSERCKRPQQKLFSPEVKQAFYLHDVERRIEKK